MQRLIIQTEYKLSDLNFVGRLTQTRSPGISLYPMYEHSPRSTSTIGTQYCVDGEAFERFYKLFALFSKCTSLLLDLYDNPAAMKEALETLEQIAEYEELCRSDSAQPAPPEPESKPIATRVLPPEIRPSWGLGDYE